MPPRRAPRRARRRPARRLARGGKFHGVKHANTSSQAQFARVVESWLSVTDLSGGQPYEVQTTLVSPPSPVSRAARVAQNYRFYRIVEVKHEFRPYHNVSQMSATDTLALPNMYYIVNRSGDAPAAFNAEYLLAQGAKPILFNRPINIKYKPKTILFGDGTAATTPLMSSCMRWIPTYQKDGVTPNFGVTFYGMAFIIQDNNGGGGSLGELHTTFVVEYKEPVAIAQTPGVGAVLVG